MGFPSRYRKPIYARAGYSSGRGALAEGKALARAIGRTDKGRGVFIIFTLRRRGDELLIRPISVRYMHKKEIEAYEKENPDL